MEIESLGYAIFLGKGTTPLSWADYVYYAPKKREEGRRILQGIKDSTTFFWHLTPIFQNYAYLLSSSAAHKINFPLSVFTT